MTRKKMVFISAAVLVQVGLAWGAMRFVIGPALRGEPLPWQEGEGGGQAHAESGEADGQVRELGPFLPIDGVLVNVAGTKGRRFCKASLSLELSAAEKAGGHGEQGGKKSEAWMPVLRGRVIDLLSSKDMDQLTAPGARDSLRTELLDALNAEVGGEPFRDLFFTEFLVQ